MSFISNFLKFFDIYSQPIEFTYQKNRNFSSFLGGFCSFIIIIILGFYMFFLLTGVNSERPILSRIPYSTLIAPDIHFQPYNTDYDSLNHSNSVVFSISFGIRNNTSLVRIDPSLINLQFYYVERGNYNNISTTKTEIKYQYLESLPPLSKEEFNFLGLKNTISPLINKTLSGTYGDPGSRYVQVDLVICSNVTSNNTCKTIVDINKFINSITFEVFVNQRKFDFSDKYMPTYVNLEQYHYNLVTGFRKIVEFKFSINKMRSHDSYWPNFLYDSWTNWYILDMMNPEESMRAFVETDNIVSTMYLYPAKEYEVIDRRYKSILEKLYIIGGLEEFFVGIGILLIYFFIKHRFEESMANDFFNIIDPINEEMILKDYSIYLKERYLDLWNRNEKKKKFSILSNNYNEKTLNKFFNKEKLLCILGLESKIELKEFLEEDIDSKDKSDMKSILDDSYKKKEGSSRGSTELMIVGQCRNKILPEFKNINMFEYFKNKIIYEIFKYECFDKMYFSITEVLLNTFCRSFAMETSKKRFKIFEIAKRKLFMEIDFFHLIRSVNELEKIKQIFFDRHQTLFFNCFSSRSITYSSIIAEKEEENSPFLIRSSFVDGKPRQIKIDKEVNKDIISLLKFEQILDNIKSRGISPIDRLLIENMGIHPEIISNFDSGVNKDKSNYNKKINHKLIQNSLKLLENNKETMNKVVEEFRRKSQALNLENI
jgi:hypothetical protein